MVYSYKNVASYLGTFDQESILKCFDRGDFNKGDIDGKTKVKQKLNCNCDINLINMRDVITKTGSCNQFILGLILNCFHEQTIFEKNIYAN